GSRLDASGATGGGTVLVGGDWQGAAGTYQATMVSMAQGAVIDASATQNGNGGKVVVRSDVTNAASLTTVDGSITTTGAGGGAGGNIETSGYQLAVGGAINAGSGGQWLLDPSDITITGDGASIPGAGGTYSTAGNVSANSIDYALSGGNHVTIDSTIGSGGYGDITVNSAIASSGAGAGGLSLLAGRDVAINANITLTGTGQALLVTAVSDITVADSKILTTRGGNVTLNSDSAANHNGAIALGDAATINSNGGNVVLGGGANPATTAAYGDDAHYDGIVFYNTSNPWSGLGGAQINAAGGNVSLNGASTNGGAGVNLNVSAQITTTGSGTVSIVGNGNRGNAVTLDRSNISTQNGAITVIGTETGGANSVSQQAGGGLLSTGSAPITVIGSGGGGFNFSSNTIGGNSASGPITLVTDTFAQPGETIQSTGALTITPFTAGTTIGIAGGAGTLAIGAASFSTSFGNTFSTITIGGPNAGTITVGGAITLRDPTTFQSGSDIVLNAPISGSSATFIGQSLSGTSVGDYTLGSDTPPPVVTVVAPPPAVMTSTPTSTATPTTPATSPTASAVVSASIAQATQSITTTTVTASPTTTTVVSTPSSDSAATPSSTAVAAPMLTVSTVSASSPTVSITGDSPSAASTAPTTVMTSVENTDTGGSMFTQISPASTASTSSSGEAASAPAATGSGGGASSGNGGGGSSRPVNAPALGGAPAAETSGPAPAAADTADRALKVVAQPPPIRPVNHARPIPPKVRQPLVPGMVDQVQTPAVAPIGVPGIAGNFSASGNTNRW
ncbi:MAG TPA: hypothetical protein VK558_01560, partial [Patescibacteria group bacterium]|nr:hypothetical protein [Patescibacteria group bacterium]